MAFSKHYNRWMSKITKYRKKATFLEDEIYLVIGNIEDGEYKDQEKIKEHLNTILDNLNDIVQEGMERYE